MHKTGGGTDVYKVCIVTEYSAVSDSNYQQLWLQVQYRKLKSFLLCTVSRLPNVPKGFLEDLKKLLWTNGGHGRHYNW